MKKRPASERQSALSLWALRTPEWALDANLIWAVVLGGLIAVFFLAGAGPALLCLGMVFAAIIALSVEPFSGALVILGGLAASYLLWGGFALALCSAYLALLVLLGVLWTLRKIRYEDRRASRASGPPEA